MLKPLADRVLIRLEAKDLEYAMTRRLSANNKAL